MDKYESLSDELYHQDTLYGMLDVKPTKNNIFKSMKVIRIENGTAHIECEPYDDSYNVEKAEQVLIRRKKKILKELNVKCLSVTFYNEWNACYGTLIQ